MDKTRTDTSRALVVAALNNESIEWTKPLMDEWMVFIEREYHPPGREAWAYLKWICAYYRDCPKTVILCQGDPFNHAPTFTTDIEDEEKMYFGRISRCDKNAAPQWNEDMHAWSEYFDLPPYDEYVFPAGAQLRLTKKNIHNRTEKFYEECFKVASKNDKSGWLFERLWGVIFGLKYDEA